MFIVGRIVLVGGLFRLFGLNIDTELGFRTESIDSAVYVCLKRRFNIGIVVEFYVVRFFEFNTLELDNIILIRF